MIDRSPCSTKHMGAVNHSSKPSSTCHRSNSVLQEGNGGDDVTLGEHDMHDVNHEFNCTSQEFEGGDEVALEECVTQIAQCSEFTSMKEESPSDSLLPLQHQTLHQVHSNFFCKWCLRTLRCSRRDKYEVKNTILLELRTTARCKG